MKRAGYIQSLIRLWNSRPTLLLNGMRAVMTGLLSRANGCWAILLLDAMSAQLSPMVAPEKPRCGWHRQLHLQPEDRSQGNMYFGGAEFSTSAWRTTQMRCDGGSRL